MPCESGSQLYSALQVCALKNAYMFQQSWQGVTQGSSGYRSVTDNSTASAQFPALILPIEKCFYKLNLPLPQVFAPRPVTAAFRFFSPPRAAAERRSRSRDDSGSEVGGEEVPVPAGASVPRSWGVPHAQASSLLAPRCCCGRGRAPVRARGVCSETAAPGAGWRSCAAAQGRSRRFPVPGS